MEILLGYGAGLLTLINPCVLPILPVVMATALQAGRSGPLLLAAGLSLSFVTLGLMVSAAGRSLGISETAVSDAAAVMMVLFGAILLVPRFSAGFAMATAGFSARADRELDDTAGWGQARGLGGQLLAGLLLGAVWTPCIGPTLGGAISLASQGESLARAGAIMLAFALGISTVILALAYGAQGAIRRRQALFRRASGIARPVLGAVFVATGIIILTDLHHVIEIWALDALPPWLIDLSVSL